MLHCRSRKVHPPPRQWTWQRHGCFRLFLSYRGGMAVAGTIIYRTSIVLKITMSDCDGTGQYRSLCWERNVTGRSGWCTDSALVFDRVSATLPFLPLFIHFPDQVACYPLFTCIASLTVAHLLILNMVLVIERKPSKTEKKRIAPTWAVDKYVSTAQAVLMNQPRLFQASQESASTPLRKNIPAGARDRYRVSAEIGLSEKRKGRS